MCGYNYSHHSSRSHSVLPDANTLHHLATFYHNTGRASEAKASFTEALKLEPHRSETVCALVSKKTSKLFNFRDRQTDTQTDRQTCRQTDKRTYIRTCFQHMHVSCTWWWCGIKCRTWVWRTHVRTHTLAWPNLYCNHPLCCQLTLIIGQTHTMVRSKLTLSSF